MGGGALSGWSGDLSKGVSFLWRPEEVKDKGKSAPGRGDRRGKGPEVGGQACWGHRKKSSWLEHDEPRAEAVR